MAFSGYFSQILTFSSLGFMPYFSNLFFITFAYDKFLYGKKDVGASLRDDEQLGPHTDLFCFDSKTKDGSIIATTTRYLWSHPGVKPFGHPLPIQCSVCQGLRTWKVVTKTKDKIVLMCRANNCSNKLEHDRPPAAEFVGGKYVDDGRHGQWLKEILVSKTL
jgi:hypothetical protein